MRCSLLLYALAHAGAEFVLLNPDSYSQHFTRSEDFDFAKVSCDSSAVC
jgi:hypothetical protein